MIVANPNISVAILTGGDEAVLTGGDGAVLTGGDGAVLTWGRFDCTPKKEYKIFQKARFQAPSTKII